MKICIVGGGNLGTAMAVDFASKNHTVNILTSRPHDWTKNISAVEMLRSGWGRSLSLNAELNMVTADATEVFAGTDYIFVTLPSHVQSDFAKRAAPLVSDKMKFVMVPGFGGAEFLMQPILKRGASLFGFQRVPFIARLKQYGQSVWFERKTSLQMAKFADADVDSIRDDMTKLFSMPCEILDNYLCITLTPSNPVLHTSRLYSMLKDDDSAIEQNKFFYADWNDATSEVLFKLDSEVQAICRALKKIDLSSVLSLKIYYESDTVSALTKKIRSIPSLSKILSLFKETPEGIFPDYDNRYFKCDFEFGLDILLQFAETLNLSAPTMRNAMNWYRQRTKNFARAVNLAEYGIKSAQDIYKFYWIERRTLNGKNIGAD